LPGFVIPFHFPQRWRSSCH